MPGTVPSRTSAQLAPSDRHRTDEEDEGSEQGRGLRVPGALLPSNLTQSVKHRFREIACLKEIGGD